MNHPAATSKHDTYATAAYRLQFLTPAFMGDANQNGRWRTPPIKALLRQWWRVAYAADKQFAVCVDEMRHAEGMLFGHAWLETDHDSSGYEISARKSQLKLRIDHWNSGQLGQDQWPKDKIIKHPEVTNPIGSNLYLGYGPLTYDKHKRASSLKANAAIQAGESAILSIAYPQTNAGLIVQALWLMHHYGTLGGRSRNGWGSFTLTADDDTLEPGAALHPRDWRQCLNTDWSWPHAIGQDDKGPLIWKTEAMPDWQAVMHHLAQLKIGLRTQFKFTTGKHALHPEDRHWLSYPVTNHSVGVWVNNARLPNMLRFKVRPDADNPSKLRGVIFHVPCLPPAEFKPEVRAIEDVWRQVHAYLDTSAQQLNRIPE